jgi:predicted transcriptional regulator
VLNLATDRFLEYEEWFVREVESGLKELADGEVASQDEVRERFEKWGANVR